MTKSEVVESNGVLRCVGVHSDQEDRSIFCGIQIASHPGVAGWGRDGRITPESMVDFKHSWLM